MKYELTNLGRFEFCEIELNGLTVIAGANASGKTTLGKAIYASTKCETFLLDNLLQNKFDIANQLISRLRSFSYIQKSEGTNAKSLNIEEKQIKKLEKLIYEKEYNNINSQPIFEEILKLLEDKNINDSLIHYGYLDLKNTLPEMIKIMKSPINFDNSSINRKLVEYAFNSEFEEQITNISHLDETTQIMSDSSSFKFGQGKCISCNINKPTFKNILYLDDVYAFDNMQTTFFSKNKNYRTIYYGRHPSRRNSLYSFDNDHRQDLISLLYNIVSPEEKTIAEDMFLDNVNEEANKIFKNILSGQVQFSKKEKRFVYNENQQNITLRNTASGIKSVALMELLFRHGYIRESTCLIIDEPETHLHPEWQIKMAKLLVLLSKKIGVRILISTHSPYLVEALRTYSQSYELTSQTKFYYVECSKKEFISNLVDVSDDISIIFDALAEPYKKLDEEYLGKHGDT